jgi:hypothetical protein
MQQITNTSALAPRLAEIEALEIVVAVIQVPLKESGATRECTHRAVGESCNA